MFVPNYFKSTDSAIKILDIIIFFVPYFTSNPPTNPVTPSSKYAPSSLLSSYSAPLR
jgi:hypothetical protein